MTDFHSQPVTSCQACGSGALTSVFFVGYIPPVNTMPPLGDRPGAEETYPLELVRCGDCGLVQIGFEVDKRILFPPDYPYRSNSTRILRENFAQLFEETRDLLGLKAGDLVVDIGSNDGTLLSSFHAGGLRVLGIEPSRAADDANAKGIQTRMAYFTGDEARSVRAEFGAAKLVTAANVFAHIANIGSIIDGITDLLDDDGVFVSESHYLLPFVETLQYDTIYHEHLRYYHLGALKALLERHGLEVFHARSIPTHGGSIRVYAGRPGRHPINPSVQTFLEEEMRQGLADGSVFVDFRSRVAQTKLDLLAMLADIKREGKRVYGLGAPSRATTLINYVGLDDFLIDCVLEISTSPKVGRFIPGTRIPVLDEARLFSDPPDYTLLLSWHIAPELTRKLRDKGYKGKFIVPLPHPMIMD